MYYQSYLLECDYLETTKIVLTTLDDMEETYDVSYINGNIICVNTLISFEELYDILIVDLELTLGITYIDKDNFVDTVAAYNLDVVNQITEFFDLIMVSDDIDYFLDLIIELGSYEMLSYKEKDCLKFLSKNV